MDSKFGFAVAKKVNGMLYFFVDDVEGIEVSLLSKKQGMNGEYIKKDVMSCKIGHHQELNKQMRLYSVALSNYAFEVKVNGQSAVCEIARGALNWN